MTKPYLDLYKASWPRDRQNTPGMEVERDRVRGGLIALLTAPPAPDLELTSDQRIAVQWQAVALALVDVLDAEQVLMVVNVLPAGFSGALKEVVTQARLADHKGLDRGHVPLRAISREEGACDTLVYGSEEKALLARIEALEEVAAEAFDLFRSYYEQHTAKIPAFESIVQADVSEESVSAARASIADTERKALRNKSMAEKIDAVLYPSDPLPTRGDLKALFAAERKAERFLVDGVAEVLYAQRGRPPAWEDAVEAEPESDAGTLVDICRMDARAVLAHLGEELQ